MFSQLQSNQTDYKQNYPQIPMDYSRFEFSRMDSTTHHQNFGYSPEELMHSHCNCEHCLNNTKPIPIPVPPRQTSPKQFSLNPAEAFLFTLKKIYGFFGSVYIPDIFFFNEGTLYYSSDSGKLKIKQKMSNQEAKKYLEERKKRYYTRAANKTGISLNISTSNYSLADRESKQKQTPFTLLYRNGTITLMSQSHFNKIIFKRKTDPFWQQALAVYVAPIPKQTPIQFKSYRYIRNADTSKTMISVMERLAKEVDEYESAMDKEEFLNHRGMDNSTMLNANETSLNFSQIPSQPQFNTHSQLMTPNKNPSHLQVSTIFKNNLEKGRNGKIKKANPQQIFTDIIAYMEIYNKIRVLQIEIRYLQDYEGLPIMMDFYKFIASELLASQQCYLHDRYKTLDPIGDKELIEYKKQLDKEDEQTLWNVCISILESCLEQRRVQLKLEQYQKPSKQNLKQMFLKLFPQFSSDQIFSHVNWKNELESFMRKTKLHIDEMIRKDEGISILKRFGVVFHRTFG